ncbi:hypothetical protein ABZP36_009132 [Zizania latifolia]
MGALHSSSSLSALIFNCSHAAADGTVYGGERWQGHQQQQQQHEEESKAVKVSVWWDFQWCRLPPGANPCRVAPRVTAALWAAGIRGPVEITAFGDACALRRGVQEALVATGVAFSHVPLSCVFPTHYPSQILYPSQRHCGIAPGIS